MIVVAGLRPGVPARRPGGVVLPSAGARLRCWRCWPRCSSRSSSPRRCRLLLLPRSRRPRGRRGSPAAALLRASLPGAPPVARRRGRSRPGHRRWLCCVGVSVLAMPCLGEEFLPDFKETDFLMHWVEKPGTSLEAMRRITLGREPASCARSPACATSAAHIGRAEVADEVVGPNFTELWISLDPEVDYDAPSPRCRRSSTATPACTATSSPTCRSGSRRCSPARAPRWWCASTAPTWTACARRPAWWPRPSPGSPGVVDLKVEPQVLVPQIEVAFRPEAAAPFGLHPGRRAARGRDHRARDQGRRDRPRTRRSSTSSCGARRARRSPESLRELPIDTRSGGQVPLGELAEVRVAPPPT